MYTVFVLYGQPSDAEAFRQHYEQVHAPLGRKIPGLKRFESTHVVATPDGSTPSFHQVVMLTFDTPEAAQAGLQSTEGQAAVQDIGNFATGGATVLLGPTESLA